MATSRSSSSSSSQALPTLPPKLSRPSIRSSRTTGILTKSTLSASTSHPISASAPSTPPKDTGKRHTSFKGKDLASSNGNASNVDGNNIEVVVRCRARSPGEVRENATLVASTIPTRGHSVTLTDPSLTITTSSSSSTSAPLINIPTTKTYNFGERKDKEGNPSGGNVFGPDADQGMLYNDIAKPFLKEVMAGYNCTIFAYGQTGTGKTYTMEGDLTPYHGTFSPSAGIIPRTLYALFDKLAEDRAEFSVRCSFIELYNEELRDLNAAELAEPHATGGGQPMDKLSNSAPSSGTTKDSGLKIYDDKNGGTGVLIQGLQETWITSAEEGLKVLKRGSERRQIAATKCNEQSSRSHSIFTITVHIKEGSKSGGEEMLKIGKLNLVDLAGSENVGRSGAEKGRAREAGMINASLLALGRVINKLVEKQSHIPYRESKLTRLLQDSLGGRTKTCIIATISPVNFEETISTLDYALRAKTIQNRPELNQRMTKNIILNQYAAEIERLQSDLLAAREKNGVYVSPESWSDLNAGQDANRIQLEEAKRQIEINDSKLQTTRDQFEQNLRLLGTRESELKELSEIRKKMSGELVQMTRLLSETKGQLDEETVVREAFERSRIEWKTAAGNAFGDVEGLRAKLARKAAVESTNMSVVTTASSALSAQVEGINRTLSTFKLAQEEFVNTIAATLSNFTEREIQELSSNHTFVSDRLALLESDAAAMLETSESMAHQGEKFRRLVANTRSEMVEGVELRASIGKTQQKLQMEAIVAGLLAHEEETRATINALVEPICILHAESLASLAADAHQLRLSQEEDRAAVQNENEHLKATIQQLRADHKRQRQAAEDADADTLAVLTAAFKARAASSEQNRSSTLENLSNTLQSRSEDRVAQTTKRLDRSAMMTRSNLKSGETYERINTLVNDIVATRGESLRSSIASIHQDVLALQLASASTIDEMSKDVQAAASKLEVGGTTFRSDASTSHETFSTTFSHHIESLRQVLVGVQTDLVATREDVEVTSEELHSAIQSQAASTRDFVATSSHGLASLRKDIKTYLESNIQIDLPTGSTPVKRLWPKEESNGIDLDADRGSVLSVLLKKKSKRGLLEKTPRKAFGERTNGATPRKRVVT